MRGFAIIGLRNPKSGENVGGALRAAHCYGAAGVIIDGNRRNNLMHHPTDTMKTYRHTPVQWVDDLFEAIPYDCVPIAIELHERSKPLSAAKHPERAIYIFGAEDATLGAAVSGSMRKRFLRASKRNEWPSYNPGGA